MLDHSHMALPMETNETVTEWGKNSQATLLEASRVALSLLVFTDYNSL